MFDDFLEALQDSPFEEIPVDARTFIEGEQYLNQPGLSDVQYQIVEAMSQIYRKEEPKKIGGNYLSAMLYGIKTFADNAKNMVRVEIASSGF